MLFAVGGGFFSSSASGYSKGLSLLLLGQKNEENPMRVIPWNQYPLVEQKTVPDLQLASAKNKFVCRCASFICFGHAATARSSSPLKVESAQNQAVLTEAPVLSESNLADHVDDDDNDRKLFSLKSSLKKVPDSSTAPVVATTGDCANSSECDALSDKNNTVARQLGRRKVQWTDTVGGELFEVREFEMSDSDDDFRPWNEKTCSCTIM